MRKKFLLFSYLCTFCMFIMLNTINVQAEQYGDWEYEVLEDGTVEITGYSGSETRIEIPSEINGVSVQEIGSMAFYNCDALEEVIIPEGIITIGESAFAYCDNLESINIPKSVINMSMYVFSGDEKLVVAGSDGSRCNIEFAWDEEIPIYGFAGCNYLESVIIPEGVKYISYGAFKDCTNLKDVTIPETVRGIGIFAFYDCEALKEIIIPKSVQYIGSSVFNNGVMVYGYEDSEIEVYAREYGLQYESLGKKDDTANETELPGCYEYSLKAIKATEEYLNYFYCEKYPDLGTTLEWGTEEEKRIITELGLSITEKCVTEEEKIRACYEWVRDNLRYDGSASVLPADVLQRGSAACVGYATLLRDLLRVNGINAVMVDGYYGDMVNTVPVSWLGRENWEAQGLEGHAWVEVQYNNQWYLLDSLWEMYMYDAEETAKWAYVESVEGVVTVHYDGIPDDVANGVVFKDNKLYLYQYGMKTLGNWSIMLNTTELGMATAYETRSGMYCEDGNKVEGLDNGELIADGWYGYNETFLKKGNISYYRPYGITMNGAFVEHNGKLMYLGINGSPFILSRELSEYTQMKGNLVIEVGEDIDLFSLMPWYNESEDKEIWFEDYASDYLILSDDGTKITGKSPGLAFVEWNYGNKETGSLNAAGNLTFYVVDRVEEISLSVNELDLYVDDTYHLSWELEGKDPKLGYYLKNKWVEITSSNEGVATVSCTGRIEALSAGEAYITVRSKDNEEVEAVCKVTVAGSTATVTSDGIMMVSKDRNTIVAGHVSEVSEATDRQYRWTAFNKTTQREIIIQDWTDNNEWLNWSPDSFGEYVITGEVRVKDNPASTATASTEAFEFNPHIKGKCQMPYYGEGGGYLIGVESYENPNQSYYYEMLILDCTLLAEGKPAWVYTTGMYKVGEGNAGWCIWQPQYGYYWTLFRVYDANGVMIDQACYGFANVY